MPRTKQSPKPRPKRVGRPASAYPERFSIRHTPEQLAAWRAAAALDDRELQSWIRHSLDKLAEIAEN